MLDVIKTEVDRPASKQSNAVIIGSVDVNKQNKISQVTVNQFDHPISPQIFSAITPLLQCSNTPVL